MTPFHQKVTAAYQAAVTARRERYQRKLEKFFIEEGLSPSIAWIAKRSNQEHLHDEYFSVDGAFMVRISTAKDYVCMELNTLGGEWETFRTLEEFGEAIQHAQSPSEDPFAHVG